MNKVSFIGAFFILYLIVIDPMQAETFAKHGNNGTVSCATFCAGARWDGGVGSCVSAYNTKYERQTDCNNVPGLLGGPELTCTCKEDPLIRFPLTDNSGTKELGDHRRMKSSAKLSANGGLNVKTTTWTAKHWSGFTGGVFLYFLDVRGNVLGVSNVHSYGVDGTRVVGGSASRRDDYWGGSVPQSLLPKITKLEIVHSHNPQGLESRAKDLINGSCGLARATYSDLGKFCP